MKTRNLVSALVLVLLTVSMVQGVQVSGASTLSPFAKGIDFPAYTANGYLTSDSDASLKLLAATGANWVGLQVEWIMPTATSTIIAPSGTVTPSDASLIHAISLAHSLGMKAELRLVTQMGDGSNKKQIAPSNWNAWFQSYTTFMVYYGKLGQANGVDMIMLGGELDPSVFYVSNWLSVISAVRQVYSGLLSYGASHSACISSQKPVCQDGFREVTWWGALDIAAVDAYFLISSAPDSSVNQMVAGCVSWEHWIADLMNWEGSINKPVIFTEIGYGSYKGSPMNPAAEPVVTNPIVDLQEQNNAYQAALSSLYGQPWLKGMFWWQWDLNPNSGGSNDYSYTPQNKPAQQTLTTWDSMNWDTAPPPTSTLLTANPLPVCYTSISSPKLYLSRTSPKTITVYVELPPGYNPANIALSSVKINGTVLAIAEGTIADFNNDYISDTSFVFSRQALQALIGSSTGTKVLVITGYVGSVRFGGTVTINVYS